MKTLIIFIIACCVSFLSYSQPSDSTAYFLQKANTDFDARLYLSASKSYDRVISLDANNFEAYLKNGKAKLEMSKIYEAGQLFERAYALEPNNEEVIEQLSTLYFNNRQYQKALDLVQKCKACKNTDLLLGMGYYHLEDYGKAIQYLQKAIEKNSNNAQAYYSLARTALELEQSAEAIGYLQKAIKIDSSRYNWKYELGLLFYNAENYKEALSYFDKAIAGGLQKNNDVLENYGFAQIYNGNSDAGIATLEIVNQRKPNNTTLLTNIAYALYAATQYDKAISYYEKVLIINARDASALYMAGMSFQKMGQEEKGQKLCDKAIEMDPSLAKNRQKKQG